LKRTEHACRKVGNSVLKFDAARFVRCGATRLTAGSCVPSPMKNEYRRLEHPEFWRSHLGLLPVPLALPERYRQFVLLNGTAGNFCLDATGQAETDGRSLAWSCDVGHFVALQGDYVTVEQWNRRETLPSRFRVEDIVSRLPQFHRFLQRTEPNRDQSIVSHGLRVLGQLRALCPPDTSPEVVIQLFLMLLASAVDRMPPSEINFAKWNLAEERLPPVAILRNEDWTSLRQELVQSRPISDLRPDVALLLRHASGALFQEVHYEAYQSPLMTLPGFLPASARVSKVPASARAGVFFTPPALARTLVEATLEALTPLPSSLCVFDPACGSGEFLKEAIRQLEMRGYQGHLELIGWDVLPVPVQMSRFSLAFEASSPRSFYLKWRVEQKNSLSESSWPKDVDVILTNPPFAALHLLDSQQKRILLEIAGAVGRPNLASAFLVRGVESVRRGGVLGAIIPSAITDAYSGAVVRGVISKEFRPLLIAKLGYQAVFLNSLVDAGIYVGVRDRKPATRPARIVWADHQPESISDALRNLRMLSANNLYGEVVDTERYSIYPSTEIGFSDDPWSPKPYRSLSILRRYSALPTLGKLFNIRQGVRLGHDDLLQPDTFVLSLPQKERKFFRPAVVNATLRRSRLLSGISVWYPNSPGLPPITSEHDLQKFVPTFYERVLAPVRSRLKARAGIDPKRWWDLIWPRSWQFSPRPKLITAYFGGLGSVAFDRSGEYVVVVGHAWLPRTKAPAIEEGIAYAYVALGASALFGTLLEACSVHVGGGQLSFERRFIGGLPVPDLLGDPRIPARLIRQLSLFGRTLSEGVSVDEAALNDVVSGIYDSGSLSC